MSDANPRRSVLVPVCASVLAVTGYAAALVSRHAIDVAAARRLLPRWDLAAHLAFGWTDAFYLKTLQWHRLLWDLWLQGYWPPGPSLFQLPFYLVLGGDMTSGLRSSLGAFVLTVLAGTVILCLQWNRAAWLPAALFLLFVLRSPFYLAYASVAMTEMLGALAQLVVLACHARYEQQRSPAAARLFAIALTLLFFTKYNYFIMLAVPLLAHEYLRRTAAWGLHQRAREAWHYARRWLGTWTGALLAAYLLAVLVVTMTGGFSFSVFGQRVGVRSIGNSGYVALYLLLGRVWFLHRRGRIDWSRITSSDARIGPLLWWFALPVIVWLASPFPNHMKDIANLVINAPMGAASATDGLLSYGAAVRADYFADLWLLVLAVAGFVVAALRFQRQPPVVQLLILAALIQTAMVLSHQTRFARFLAFPVLLVWLTSASEIGTWVWRRSSLVAGMAATVVMFAALLGARDVVSGEPFRRLAFENYIDSPALADAFAAIRGETGPSGRVAVLGRSDALSPGLFTWQLGPPAGLASFPLEVLRDRDVESLGDITHVVLIAPDASDGASPEITADFPRHLERLQRWLDAGTVAPARELPVDDLHLTLRLYARTK